ncbi:myosin IC heavy chain [Bos taurus]|uniref:myosin IC heavy chain n=1 Tax=Bos taurus TaxID=9913 RepID=UPI0028CB179F|nr:myosin IC heavy chain-like [Bos taurus]
MPPRHGTSAAQKLGAPPGRLPAPTPPHLHRAAPCSAPGRPQRSTGAPPGSSLPRAATRSGPVRPGPASAAPPARPGPRPAQVGGAARGRVRGVTPPPGRGHAQAPGVTRVRRGARWSDAAGLRFPPSEARWLCVWGSAGSRLGGGGSPSTLTWAPGPAAAGHCSSTKGQAPRQPPFPLRSSSRCLTPRHTLRLQSTEREVGGNLTPNSGPCVPEQVRGRRLVGACPTPSGLQKAH